MSEGEGTSNRFSALVLAPGVEPVNLRSLGLRDVAADTSVSFDPLGHLDTKRSPREHSAVVWGGGDNAHYTALDLAESGWNVDLVIRSKPSAQGRVRARVEEWVTTGTITEYSPAQIVSFARKGGQLVVELESGIQLATDRVFGRLGFTVRNSDLLESLVVEGLKLTSGRIQVDRFGETSLAGCFAIGDAASTSELSIAEAVANGAVTARAIERMLR